MKMKTKFNKYWLIPLALILAIGLYYIPPIHSRLAWRLDALRTQIIYYFNPPDEVIFHPSGQTALNVETVVATTRAEFLQTLTPQMTSTSTPTSGPTLTPTATSVPLPASVSLPGVKYIDQRMGWNYCGPANLTMALSFWGWKGDPHVIAKVVKPGSGDMRKNFIDRGRVDKNVMPYELVDFVNNNTEYRALMRQGGDENLIKRLIAAGFPVIVEKGYYEADYTGKVGWLGHYLFTTGYDDTRGGFIVQDTWLVPGKNLLNEYGAYQEGWRNFNYLFMVVYPADRETEVMNVLGSWADETWSVQHALELAEKDILTVTGNNLFFAWFNEGTNYVASKKYVDASNAYDKAFSIYAGWDLGKTDRPWRMMWYQTGPYFAYYYAGRYQDVINLANTTLFDPANKTGNTLEESLLWRGRAYYQIGNTQAAVDDYRATLKIHTGWVPAIQALQDLGLQP